MSEGKDIKEYIEDGFDKITQQQNANHSSNIAQLQQLNSRMAVVETTLKSVEAQTIKTNGRVTKIETDRSEEKGKKEGGWKAWTILGVIIFALIGVIYANVESQIKQLQYQK
jgi:hypothetical protein